MRERENETVEISVRRSQACSAIEWEPGNDIEVDFVWEIAQRDWGSDGIGGSHLDKGDRLMGVVASGLGCESV